MTERIKDVWYAVILHDKIRSVHESQAQAQQSASIHGNRAKVERVQIEITRIKTS